ESVGGRIPAGHREFARGLLLDDHDNDDTIGYRSRLAYDLDGLEVAEVLEPPFGARNERAIVGVAFAQIEFAPDHVVLRPGIAADVDLLDVGPRAFLDPIHEIDHGAALVAHDPWTHDGERMTTLGELDGHVLGRLFHGFGIEHIAG